MKKTLLTLTLMAMTMTMMAVPAKRGQWTTIRLANGTEVRAELKGDEHQHWMQAADGTCYAPTADGVYEVSTAEVMQARRQARLAAKYAKRKAIYASTSDGLGKKGTMSRGSVPSIGEYTIPVVMVQFSDKKFKSTTTVEKMTRYYNEEGYKDESGCKGSMRDYFKAQSSGQFVPTFDVVGIVTLSNNYSYYGKNDRDGNDQNLDALPADVVSAAINVRFLERIEMACFLPEQRRDDAAREIEHDEDDHPPHLRKSRQTQRLKEAEDRQHFKTDRKYPEDRGDDAQRNRLALFFRLRERLNLLDVLHFRFRRLGDFFRFLYGLFDLFPVFHTGDRSFLFFHANPSFTKYRMKNESFLYILYRIGQPMSITDCPFAAYFSVVSRIADAAVLPFSFLIANTKPVSVRLRYTAIGSPSWHGSP